MVNTAIKTENSQPIAPSNGSRAFKASTGTMLVYGHRPRSDMFRVMLAELGLDAQIVNRLSLDHKAPYFIDSEILTESEKIALMAVGPLGAFRHPIFVLDNAGFVWPENLEVLNTLERVSAIPDIIQDYHAKSWVDVEVNLRAQTARALDIKRKPRALTETFNLLVLVETTSDIPKTIRPSLDEDFLQVDLAFSASEANYKAESSYSNGRCIDAVLDLTENDLATLGTLPKIPVKHFRNSVELHGQFMLNRSKAPLRPQDMDFDEKRLLSTFTYAFPKVFWKHHAKLQISTYARLKTPISIFTIPLTVDEEGQLTGHLNSHDCAGRVSKTRMAVVLLGKSYNQGEAFLADIGLETGMERIALTHTDIDRL